MVSRLNPRVLLGLLALALAGGGLMWLAWRPNPHRRALAERELAARGLAERLAQAFPGQRALVVSNPFAQSRSAKAEFRRTEEAGIRGLQEGFGAAVTLKAVVFPELKPAAASDPRSVFIEGETTTPLSYLMAEGAFDTLTAQHPDCELVVSLIGLPADLLQLRSWQKPGPPRFAALLPDLRFLGDAAAVAAAAKSGKLAAFALPRPGAPSSASALSQDWKGEFEKRFVLVTAENVEQVQRAHPELFQW